MKKLLSLFLAVIFVLSFAACTDKAPANNDGDGNKTTDAKFGLGIYSTYSEPADADAEEENNGKVGVEVTVAAVLVGEDGKIIACKLDATANELGFTPAGEALTAGEFKTKREQGDAYGMVAWGGAKLEWYAQADAFEKLVIGKTLDEVKALVANGKNADAVISAGCTITASEFVLAIEKACANATTVKGAADGALGLGIVSAQSDKISAEGEDNGKVGVDVTITASVLDSAKKSLKTVTDGVSVSFEFTAEGKCVENTAKIQTKREQGDAYGMVAWGGAKLEWYAQADAFDAVCAGKTKADLETYVAGDKADLVSAGCTIYVGDMAKAAIKSLDVK